MIPLWNDCPLCGDPASVDRDPDTMIGGGCVIVTCSDPDCPASEIEEEGGRREDIETVMSRWQQSVTEQHGCSGCGEVIRVDALEFTVDGDERYHWACRHLAHWSARDPGPFDHSRDVNADAKELD